MVWAKLFLLSFLLGSAPARAAPEDFTLDLDSAGEAGREDFGSGDSGSDHSGGSGPVRRWRDYFAQNPSLSRMSLGIQMSGTEPLARNASTPMIPASIEKLFSASAALQVLGSAMRFENQFTATLDTASGAAGNLEFFVSGDPTWANENYETLTARLGAVIDALKLHGVKRVHGPVRIHSLRRNLARAERPSGWNPDWVLQCMAQIQTEFQANGNCGTFQISSPERFAWVTPGVSVPVVVDVVRSRSGTNSVRVVPELDDLGRITRYTLSGGMGASPISFVLPVHEGKSWLKNLFLLALKQASIEYRANALPPPEPGESDQIKVDLSSRPLIEILRLAVQKSLNGVMDRIYLELEHFLQVPARTVLGTHVALVSGSPALMEGVSLLDGSGLNLQNRVRADLVYAFLSHVREMSWFSDLFGTLAVAGVSGTLETRPVLTASPFTNGKIFAKTGTLTGVTNLAGYLVTGQGAPPEPFVILSGSEFTSNSARKLIDGIVVNFAMQNTP